MSDKVENMPVVPIERLVGEVYESATPSDKTRMVSLLVGKVYADAPPGEKSYLVEYLMRPLGVLSLMAVANGIFAKIRFRGGWPDMQARLADVQNIQVNDVVALATYAQQASLHAVDGLAQTLASSSALAGSAAAVLLFRILMERAKTRREDD